MGAKQLRSRSEHDRQLGVPDYEIEERENEDSNGNQPLTRDVVSVIPNPMIAAPMAWNPTIMNAAFPVSRASSVKPSIADLDVKPDCFRCCQHSAQAKQSHDK
jgi:hypothetical protein